MQNNLKKILMMKNISQKQLSLMTGITPSAICRYAKNERNPRGDCLIKIAQALGVEASEIFDDGVKRNDVFDIANEKIDNLRSKIKQVKILVRKLNYYNPTVKEIRETLKGV